MMEEYTGDITKLLPMELDTKSGAPGGVRFAVGAAPNNQDRLATIRKFFPDAKAYGDDNFIYTDPKSGRPTVYNPKGLDFGDIPSIAPEIGEYMGGTAASVAPILATPATGGASLLATPVAYGLGAGAGREAVEGIGRAFYGTQDSRSLPKHLADTGTTIGANAVGARVGELAETGLRSLVGGSTGQAVRANLDDFTQAGVAPTAGAVSGSRMVQSLEHAVGNTPGGAATMQAAAGKTISDLQGAARRIAEGFGSVESKARAGEILAEGAEGAAKRFKQSSEQMYSAAFSKVGADTPASLDNLVALKADLQNQLSKAPDSLASTIGKALDEVKAIELDAAHNGGTLPFETLRAIRTKIGRELNDPVLVGSSGALNDARKRTYEALTVDMKQTASNVSDDARRAIDNADLVFKNFMNGDGAVLNKIGKVDSDKALDWALAEGKAGGNRLSALRRQLEPEEWSTIAGTTLGKMGLANPGAQNATGEVFSPSTFLTNWNKLSPEAKHALFGGNQYAPLREQLDRVVRISATLKQAEGMANPSGTARALNYQAVLTALGAGAIGAASGDPTGGFGTAAAATISPYAAAKLMTRPSFVRWVADVPSATARAGGSLATHLGKLGTIAKVEPMIKDEIAEFTNAMGGK